MMEDSFLRAPICLENLEYYKELVFDIAGHESLVGKICLTNEFMKRKFWPMASSFDFPLYAAENNTEYILSTQPAIWNRKFLLKYLTPGLSPWKFETQKAERLEKLKVIGLMGNTILHNEGIRKTDLYNYNFDRIPAEVIKEMQTLNII
jgi:hypothetical protein